MTDNDNKQTHPRMTAVLRDRHVEFLEDEDLNYSSLVRTLLDEYIDHCEQTEDFELNT